MRKEREKHPLVAAADEQFGVLHRDDLFGLGVRAGAIHRRQQNGSLTYLHRHVYALGHTRLQAKGRWLAALLSCGDGVCLSHFSAAAYHGLWDEQEDDPVHVSTTNRLRPRGGITIHETRHLDRVDVYRPHPFLVTHIPRTLVDMADVTTWEEFRSVADRVKQLHLRKIRQAQERAPGRVGSPLVTRLLEAEDSHTKSEFERRYGQFCRRFGIAGPDDRNVAVAGHKADCVYWDARLVVELDGRSTHRRTLQMRKDRLRDSDYQLAGFHVLRLVSTTSIPPQRP